MTLAYTNSLNFKALTNNNLEFQLKTLIPYIYNCTASVKKMWAG